VADQEPDTVVFVAPGDLRAASYDLQRHRASTLKMDCYL
jgi:hypothetical protein